jgi:hypothetical protein
VLQTALFCASAPPSFPCAWPTFGDVSLSGDSGRAGTLLGCWPSDVLPARLSRARASKSPTVGFPVDTAAEADRGGLVVRLV